MLRCVCCNRHRRRRRRHHHKYFIVDSRYSINYVFETRLLGSLSFLCERKGKFHSCNRYENLSPLNNRINFIIVKFKLYLFNNDYETSYTTYINHARSGTNICVRTVFMWEETGVPGGNRSTRRKATCLTW